MQQKFCLKSASIGFSSTRNTARSIRNDLKAIFQAVGNSMPCVVRLPALDEIVVKKTLDAGAAGLLVPQVNTAAQVEQLVRWGRYYPEGSRGLGFGRIQGYGFKVNEYLESANESILLSVQAESAEAVKNIESIVTGRRGWMLCWSVRMICPPAWVCRDKSTIPMLKRPSSMWRMFAWTSGCRSVSLG